MNTHPPIEHIQSVTIHILWRADGVGGGEVVGGFMEWVGGWWDGWLKGLWGEWW